MRILGYISVEIDGPMEVIGSTKCLLIGGGLCKIGSKNPSYIGSEFILVSEKFEFPKEGISKSLLSFVISNKGALDYLNNNGISYQNFLLSVVFSDLHDDEAVAMIFDKDLLQEVAGEGLSLEVWTASCMPDCKKWNWEDRIENP